MRFSKQTVFFLSALLLCVFIFPSFAAAENKSPMQSELWQELSRINADEGYENVAALLDKLVFFKQFPDKDEKDIIRLWLRIHQKENPQYGLLYARLHLEEALIQSDHNTAAHREILGLAVMSFYSNALLLKSDLAVCADETAGEALKSDLEREKRKYFRHYNKIDPMLQPVIIRAIKRSRDNNKNRRPDASRCQGGADPDIVSDEEWQSRREALYRETLDSLQ